MANGNPIEVIESVVTAYDNTDSFRVPKIFTAVISDKEVNATMCGVEVALHSILLAAKGETKDTDPATLAEAILCTAVETYVIGELA